jgi:hypothetical protein
MLIKQVVKEILNSHKFQNFPTGRLNFLNSDWGDFKVLWIDLKQEVESILSDCSVLNPMPQRLKHQLLLVHEVTNHIKELLVKDQLVILDIPDQHL